MRNLRCLLYWIKPNDRQFLFLNITVQARQFSKWLGFFFSQKHLLRLDFLWIILQAVNAKIIDFDECLSTLEDIIDSGFYLKDEIYIKVIRAARKLSGDAL